MLNKIFAFGLLLTTFCSDVALARHIDVLIPRGKKLLILGTPRTNHSSLAVTGGIERIIEPGGIYTNDMNYIVVEGIMEKTEKIPDDCDVYSVKLKTSMIAGMVKSVTLVKDIKFYNSATENGSVQQKGVGSLILMAMYCRKSVISRYPHDFVVLKDSDEMPFRLEAVHDIRGVIDGSG